MTDTIKSVERRSLAEDASSEAVERYSLTGHDAFVDEDKEGEYVTHDDYAALYDQMESDKHHADTMAEVYRYEVYTMTAKLATAHATGRAEGLREAESYVCSALDALTSGAFDASDPRIEAIAEYAEKLRVRITAANQRAENAEWCQPMSCGKHTPRVWIIRFEDQDVGDLTFDNETEAREMWTKLNSNWNTYLMASLPLIATAILTDTPVVKLTVQAAAELLVEDFTSDESTIDYNLAWEAWMKAYDPRKSKYYAMEAWLREIVGGSHD
jgi:hypothetical protein